MVVKRAPILLVVLVLAGCGGDGSQSGDTAAARAYCARTRLTETTDTSWGFARCVVAAKETAAKLRKEGREDDLPPEFMFEP